MMDSCTLVLVHGFAEDSRIWENQAVQLQKICKVMTPDLPGSGKVPLSDVSMEAMADYLKKILDENSVDKCIMIGHSMGGYVTLAFAEKYPERLLGFGLFHSSAYADTEEKKQTRKKAIAFIRAHGSKEFLKNSQPNLFANDTLDKFKMAQELVSMYENFDEEALVAYYEAMIARPDRTHVLKEFTKPVLMIIGKHDTAVPYQKGMEQAGLLQNPHVHTLEHSGHMGMWEEVRKSNRILLDFINNVT